MRPAPVANIAIGALRLLTLLLLALAPGAALACTPPISHLWFHEQVSVQGVSLPLGVEVKAGPDKDTVEIANTSQTPLYLLNHRSSTISVYQELAITPGEALKPGHKLVAGQVYGWEEQSDGQRHLTKKYGWSSISYTGTLILQVYDNSITTSRVQGGTGIRLEQRNERWGRRPTNVALPAPQHKDLQLVYGDQRLAVPLTISYVLNPDYDPERYAGACSDSNIGTTILACILAVILALLGIILALRKANPQLGKPRM